MNIVEDYAQYLLEEAKSPVAALHQFRILYDPHQEGYHFFFEGEEDSLFYLPEARRCLGVRQIFIYECGGKRNVIEVRDAIKENYYEMSKCLFFVDRDYDDLLGCQVSLDEHTYITDNYSIESDIPNKHSTRILLSDFLKISQADPEFERMNVAICMSLRAFYRVVLPLSAWIIAAKQEGCNPNLGNTTGLKNIIILSGLEPVFAKTGFAEFKKKVAVNNKTPSMASVLKWARALDVNSAKAWIRGKYSIWFYHIVLLAALEGTNAIRKAAGGRVVRIPAPIREGHFFEALGGRVPVPASLQAFYRSKLN